MKERNRFESEVGLLKDFGAKHLEQETPEETNCKEVWDKLLKSLPDEVRGALNAQDWNNALILAIHHGTRDLTALTRLVFHGKYGKQRGYCKLKNTRADAPYIQYWNQEKSGARALMTRPSPPLAQKGGIKCRKIERKLTDPKPDASKIDISGRYENQYQSNGRTLTSWIIGINQAGRHIEGVLSKVIYPDPRPRGWLFHQDDDPKDRPHTEFYGDLQADGSFLFFDKKDPSNNWGYFRHKNGRLFWEVSGKGKNPLTTISKTPIQMNTAPFEKVVWLREKFPLTRLQIKHLADNLAEDKIAAQLQKYFTVPAGVRSTDKTAQIDQAGKFQLYLAEVMTKEFNGVHDKDLDLGQYYVKTILTDNKWKFKGITRSQLDWIQIMLDVNVGNGFRLPAVEKYLGLKPSKNVANPQSPPHKYKVSVAVKGVGLIGAYYRGSLTVEKLDAPIWKETFKVALKGFQAVPGYKVEQSGQAETYHEWTRQDLIGRIHLVMGGAGVKVPGVKASGNAGFMHIFGTEYLPPMDVLWSDGSLKPNLSKKFGVDKPDLKGLWGEIYSKNLPDVDLSRIAVTDYAADYKLQDDVHFCLGSALLTEDARQALRIVCANELTAFSSPASVLKIVGHTDRVDTPERNLTLSLLRAENTLQAIKDILGNNFKLPQNNVKEISGKGENEAIRDNRPDNLPDPKYRRVDVFLNARLLISLKAQ